MSHNDKRISTRKRTTFGGSGEARTDREDQEEYEEQEEGRQNCSVTLICSINRRGEMVELSPPRSRATFKISVLRYRNSGGQYHPPLPRTTPLTKKRGGLCSLRFATVAKPPWYAKGGGHPISRRKWDEK